MRLIRVFLPLLAVGLAAFDTAPLDPLPAAIASYPKTTSIVVVQDGKTVYEHYFGDGAPGRLANTRSATKIFAALAVGEAIADGVIPSVHTPAFAFLRDLEPFAGDTPQKEAITMEDLLTMSSALACDDNDDASPGNEDRMHEQQAWTRWAVDLPLMAGYARDASGLGPWRYCTANAVLAGQVVQRATRTPVDRFIEDRLLKPLGIAQWQWQYSPAHETMTGGGLELTPRDWAKIAWMLEDNGRWNGRQIVPASWVEAVFTVRRASRPDQNYGYFAFEGTYRTACGPQSVWYMAGNGGSQILVLRALHAAIVVTRENYNVRGTSAQTQELLEKYVLASLVCPR